jgi:ABC-2 type transport system permease protein
MNILSLEIRNTRKSTIIWTISVGAVIYAMLAFFPSMQTEAMQQLANAKLYGVDPALLAALGLPEAPDFTVITNFFGYVLQFITLAVMVYCTNHAVGMLVKEETEGTIEYLYAKPVSRMDIFLQKPHSASKARALMRYMTPHPEFCPGYPRSCRRSCR